MSLRLTKRVVVLARVFLLSGLVLGLCFLIAQKQPPVRSVLASGKSSSAQIYLPLVMNNYIAPLCRFGVAAGQDIGSYAVNNLRIGWYVDWGATASPVRPGGMTYLPMIRFKPSGTNSYSYTPNGAVLTATVAANPGALWLLGNEPDRQGVLAGQDNLVPSVYAQAYHDLHDLIKGLDPTARIGTGAIVQPTPLRLQYLDMVLSSYQSSYTSTMPVDVWNIHAFILNETSCSYDPNNCWGADVPTGINAPYGEQYAIQQNDDLMVFEQNIVAFRQWMANNGYQDRPLIITEFGVQMPNDYWVTGDPLFTPDRVNAYMNATFNYLSSMTSNLGYPADGYHLVQRWAWYSLTDTTGNGWLFDPMTKERTVFGDNYAAYTSGKSLSVCNW